jgi:hypothetical protein
MVKGIEQDHSETAAWGLAVEVWTLWHASRYLEARPHAPYEQVIGWLSGVLPHFYASAFVTPLVERHIAERLARRDATPWA